MERLTKKEMLAGYEVHYVSADDCFDVWSTPKKFMGEAIDRLAAYEDIGLTPEEIQERLDAGKELFFERADLYNLAHKGVGQEGRK